jgi:hypothetical protein
MEPCHLLFHDESCVPGDDCFVVGLLKVHKREPIDKAIAIAREKWHYKNELHFQKMSNLRAKVYKEVLSQVCRVKEHFHFSALCVQRKYIDLKYFSGKEHLAYNFFTKLLLTHRCYNV